MTKSRLLLGRSGEDLAVDYLRRQGYDIVEQNVHLRVGEIDIVARQDETWVFVEVRTRRSNRYGSALESIDVRKQKQLIRTARYYITTNALHHAPCRIDVIAVTWHDSKDAPADIEHIQNAIMT